MLMSVTVWLCLAAAPLAAGAADHLGGLFRAGIMADAGVLVLLIVAMTGPGITWSLGWRVYLLWLAVALAAAGVAQLAQTPVARACWAVGFSTIAFAACASLIWSGGLVAYSLAPMREAILAAAAAVNPLLGLSQLLRPQGFIWMEQPVMYGLTRVGQDYPAPAIAWHVTVSIWGVVALAAWTTILARRAWQAFWWGI
jgi:hypothetical protein